jgi:para-nitrobenzyl esterase
MAWIPVVDDAVLRSSPRRADVPLLIGTTTDEWRFFYVPVGIAASLPEAGLAGIVAARGIPPAAVKVYRTNRPTGSPGDVLCALFTDGFFRLPAIAVAQAHKAAGGRAWMYEFAQPSGMAGMGACHAIDVGYVFDNLHVAGQLVGDDRHQRLADSIHGAWVEFARTGAASWPEYDDSRLVMVFDGPSDRVVADPRGDERTAWLVTA